MWRSPPSLPRALALSLSLTHTHTLTTLSRVHHRPVSAQECLDAMEAAAEAAEEAAETAEALSFFADAAEEKVAATLHPDSLALAAGVKSSTSEKNAIATATAVAVDAVDADTAMSSQTASLLGDSMGALALES